MKKGKLTIGFIFSLIAAVLALVACIVYTQVMYTMTPVYILLIAAVVLACLAFVLKPFPAEILPVVNGFLIASAAVWGAKNMVNQIGYVVSGLDGIETIQTWIVFTAIAVVAIIVNIIAGFLPQRKQEDVAKVVSE